MVWDVVALELPLAAGEPDAPESGSDESGRSEGIRQTGVEAVGAWGGVIRDHAGRSGSRVVDFVAGGNFAEPHGLAKA